MKRVSIIYWSNSGNVEILADKMAEGAKEAGAEVIIKRVSEATIEDVQNADAVAFGSPSMDNNQIEQKEMEPFINQFKLFKNDKPLVLFGSYGWDDGKFMTQWIERMQEYSFDVIGTLIVREAPTKDELEKASELGKLLAK